MLSQVMHGLYIATKVAHQIYSGQIIACGLNEMMKMTMDVKLRVSFYGNHITVPQDEDSVMWKFMKLS